MPVEQRSLPRRRSSEPAMASLGKAVSMSCVVTDISRKGARLSFGVSVSLPPRFDICLARTGELLEVHLVWQTGRDAGVRFGPNISDRLTDLILRLPASVDAARSRMDQVRTWLLGPRS